MDKLLHDYVLLYAAALFCREIYVVLTSRENKILLFLAGLPVFGRVFGWW